ncbi:hypothetical protein FTRO_0013030 [Fructobacillus tropaeoli]|uniref:Uncharacterized protein n=2 Tax=Fructobacillus tropaeoli TaxID=709323 RepID=A0A3F3GZ15_9LACO|nr:hypothetical protein FTRO_0013030 [Fructobacillus tropaeoli]
MVVIMKKSTKAGIIGAINGGVVVGISIIAEMFLPKYWHIINLISALIGGFIVYYFIKDIKKN